MRASGPLSQEPWSKRHVSRPSLYYHHQGEQDAAASSEPPTPTSPTLSECSMDSQTALIPPPPGKVRSQSHYSSLQMSRLPRSSHQISLPQVLDSSSIDAAIRSSTTPGPGIDAADLAIRPSAQSSKAGSWPNRHRRCTTLGQDEGKIPEITEPKSEFSDSDDEDGGDRSRGKSFKRRLSGTFGHCFGGRKN